MIKTLKEGERVEITGVEYIFARVGYEEVCLINLVNGNRWENPVKVVRLQSGPSKEWDIPSLRPMFNLDWGSIGKFFVLRSGKKVDIFGEELTVKDIKEGDWFRWNNKTWAKARTREDNTIGFGVCISDGETRWFCEDIIERVGKAICDRCHEQAY